MHIPVQRLRSVAHSLRSTDAKARAETARVARHAMRDGSFDSDELRQQCNANKDSAASAHTVRHRRKCAEKRCIALAEKRAHRREKRSAEQATQHLMAFGPMA